MKNQLLKTNQQNIITIDSREVAEMMGKEHSALLREIDGSKDGKTVGILPTLEKANFALSKYFIESSYKSGTREYKCYLVTKIGCELIGNKQQGEKGILFTAKYVERFNEMEKELKDITTFKLPQTFAEALRELASKVEENEQLKIENSALSKDILEWVDENLINAIVRKYGASIGNFGESWVSFKKEILYKYSINLNSRITNYLNTTGKKTKPKTLSMLRGKEELTQGLKVAITLCKNKDINISDILGTHMKEIERLNLN